jgi:acyl-CoA hydrolase
VEIGVRVEAEDLRSGRVTHTNSAYLVFVAVDDDGRPIAVPTLVPETAEQKTWLAAAQKRRLKRLQEREPADS